VLDGTGDIGIYNHGFQYGEGEIKINIVLVYTGNLCILSTQRTEKFILI
jgi:hypothetical protein